MGPHTFLNLVSLKSVILCSSIALVISRLDLWDFLREFHEWHRVCAVSHTSGNSREASQQKSSLGSLFAFTVESCCPIRERIQSPTSFVRTHSSKQWGRSANTWFGQNLQNSEEFGKIRASRASVGRTLWIIFHTKLNASGPIPRSLALRQVTSQSVAGEEISVLTLIKSRYP